MSDLAQQQQQQQKKRKALVKTITGAADNGGGLIRITCLNHAFFTQDRIQIAGVNGTTEAVGKWPITVISGNTFDLQGSAFVHAYVSGGTATRTQG